MGSCMRLAKWCHVGEIVMSNIRTYYIYGLNFERVLYADYDYIRKVIYICDYLRKRLFCTSF